ncbi:MAG: class I SAM-dependent methyltransferase [Flavobacteriaceae bacterium]|nr:class I SAM-dependent methyltransferase [Flavobacteriaceae bacterium]
MNKLLLQQEVQDFIHSYEQPLTALAFSGSPFEGISVQELLQQIEGRRKAYKKLPTWYAAKGVIYPPKLNLEQTSSERTAAYKASLCEGGSCIDVTGGFGIDTLYFAQHFDKVAHCEQNHSLAELAQHNLKLLSSHPINFYVGDGLENALSNSFDLIFIDPSRRHDSKGKVFYLKDCEPQVPQQVDKLLDHCQTLMIKTSPMLDIGVGLKELKQVTEIHIVAVQNEVKELLWIIRKESSATKVITINLTNKGDHLFTFNHGDYEDVSYSTPREFLYEPNAAILKSGAFTLLPSAFGVQKLAQHTHLYTSDEKIDFPGRRFQILEVKPYSKKDLKGIRGIKAHISTRNFPESVATLRKKWNIKDGGERYLFFATLDNDQKVLIVTQKV